VIFSEKGSRNNYISRNNLPITIKFSESVGVCGDDWSTEGVRNDSLMRMAHRSLALGRPGV